MESPYNNNAHPFFCPAPGSPPPGARPVLLPWPRSWKGEKAETEQNKNEDYIILTSILADLHNILVALEPFNKEMSFPNFVYCDVRIEDVNKAVAKNHEPLPTPTSTLSVNLQHHHQIKSKIK